MQSLRDGLIKAGLLTKDQVKEAVAQGRKTGETLINSVLKLVLVKESDLITFLEKEMDFPRVDLATYSIDQKALALVPYKIAKKHKVIPLFRVGDVLTIATIDPFDIVAIDELRAKSKCTIEPMVSALNDIEQALNQSYGVAGSVKDLIKNLGQAEEDVPIPQDVSVEEAPIAKLVNLLIMRAVTEKASDIHVDPTASNVRFRYRLDGVLHDVSTAPLTLLPSITTRIKIMAEMDIAESRVPQDGRFKLKLEGKEIDVRVSSYPAVYGEAIVMRILDKASVLLSLKEIGFSDQNLAIFEEAIKRPHGIILVTGPTGSGKTTTLYATLNHIVGAEKNIMTIEDPVEYELQGIRQAQTNPKAGLEFANALRSMLRQDPDVILVGEIRDMETAKVATQASLTGHLVFSTLHTNDSAGALTRLEDMGIEPFLIASSVAAVMAQRLVRTICSHCKEAFSPSKEILKKMELTEGKKQFFKGKGCKVCRETGYKGRTTIMEILTINDEIRELILQRSSSAHIKLAAIKAGMKTLREDGLEKVQAGITTIDEVMRVTQLD